LEKLGAQDGSLFMLDALHSNQQTLRQIVQDNSGDYLVPVKGNHDGLQERIEAYFAGRCEAVTSPLSGQPQSAARIITPGAVRYRRKPR
jgi:hypothetical protein